jgi:hypothetical protein
MSAANREENEELATKGVMGFRCWVLGTKVDFPKTYNLKPITPFVPKRLVNPPAGE